MKFPLLAVVLLACSCASPKPWERKGEWFYVCDAPVMDFDEVSTLLNRYGIECFWLTGDMGCQDVFVVGKEVAFKARSIIRENAEKEKLRVFWVADALVLGAEEESQRVAEVTVESGSTSTVVDLLESRGIERKFYFGAKKDRILVPRNRVREALGVLREKPIPGVDVMTPEGF